MSKTKDRLRQLEEKVDRMQRWLFDVDKRTTGMEWAKCPHKRVAVIPCLGTNPKSDFRVQCFDCSFVKSYTAKDLPAKFRKVAKAQGLITEA